MQLIRFTLLALFIGLGVGYQIFSVPIHLTLRTNLDDCARQETREGCLESKTAGCLWKNVTEVMNEPSITFKISDSYSKDFICLFPDYESVDCSLFNNNSDSCQLFEFSGEKKCEYRFVTDKCVHRAGLNDVETGVFSACSIGGGVFGPYLFGKFDHYFGHFKTFFLLSFFASLSALLFTIGIENGNIGLWSSSKVFSSMVSMAGASLFPEVLRDSSSLQYITLHQRGTLMRLLGMCIGSAALLSSVFLYGDTPRGQFVENPVFNVRLQNFNIVQWLIGVGFLIFGFAIKYGEWFDEKVCCCLAIDDDDNNSHHEDEKKKEEEEQEKKKQDHESKLEKEPSSCASSTDMNNNNEPTNTSTMMKDSSSLDVGVKITTDDAVSNIEHEDEEELAAVPEERLVMDENIPQEQEIHDDEQANENAPAPTTVTTNPTETVDDHHDLDALQRKKTLQWAVGILITFSQQFIGLGPIASYTPIILQQTISDPILAQLCFAAGFSFGAILSGSVLSHYVRPAKLFIFGAFSCCLSGLFIGLALMPGVFEEKSNASSGLGLFGLILFAISFGSGPSSMFFASLADTFKVPGTLQSGMAVSTSSAVLVQLILRLVFPIYVSNVSDDVRVGRATAFFGFCVLGLIFTTCLVVCRSMLQAMK